MRLEDVRNCDDLREIIESRDVEFVTVAMPDLQGLLRGKYMSRSKFLGALESGYGMPTMVFALEPTDAIMKIPGISDDGCGFADGVARILPETVREIPWERPHRNLFVLAEMSGEDEAICPRAVYRRVAERAADMGFRPFHACELEFTLFNETATSAFEKGYKNLDISTPHKSYGVVLRQLVRSEFYDDLLETCRHMRIPLDVVHEEMGPGFMEAALSYREGIEAADNAVIFKTFAKAVAQRRGQLMTFMTRWSNEADGQSGHVHISLRDKDGNAVFHDPAEPRNMSLIMRHFLGGMQKLMPELLLLMGPSINAFKRYVPDIFSPIAATWGWENRTCALRVIAGPPNSQRIECRTPGADANPYLSLACLLASGLHGIEHGIEPSAETIGNVYSQTVPEEHRFPASFSEAIIRLEASDVARDLFGERFIEIFTASRASQDREFRALVTDVELQRFFEFS